MGAERWIEGDDWPLAGTRYETYYLRGGKSGSAESLNDGRLTAEAPTGDEPADEYTHDPYDPIPAIGGHGGYPSVHGDPPRDARSVQEMRRQMRPAWQAGPQDQYAAEVRSLTFTTDVLERDVEVVGVIPVRFWASSSAVDTDFVLTLSAVYPNGYSAILRQNAIRGRFRETEERETLLEPGKVYEFAFTLDGIANLFKKGHRIRLRISSSTFPAFLPNPGTAEPMMLAAKGVVARNAIYHDAEHPSSIELPVRG
jgi:putative CocE/NonD family hydrolase